MNASMDRSGKSLTSQLREATQSHLLSKQEGGSNEFSIDMLVLFWYSRLKRNLVFIILAVFRRSV